MKLKSSPRWNKNLLSCEEAEEILKKTTLQIRLGKRKDQKRNITYYELGSGSFCTKDGLVLAADHNLRPYKRRKYFNASD
jgi:hypothetical protein